MNWTFTILCFSFWMEHVCSWSKLNWPNLIYSHWKPISFPYQGITKGWQLFSFDVHIHVNTFTQVLVSLLTRIFLYSSVFLFIYVANLIIWKVWNVCTSVYRCLFACVCVCLCVCVRITHDKGINLFASQLKIRVILHRFY